MNNYEILRAAAEHLGQVGLFQGDYFQYPDSKETSPCCGWGAIDFISSKDKYVDRVALKRQMSIKAFDTYAYCNHYPHYNDTPGRTQEEVITFMLELAQELEDEQNSR